jgi:hypothetical protein
MNATPPEAKPEYSRGSEPSGGLARIGSAVPAAVFAGGLLGALLLVVAEFTTLFEVHTALSPVAVTSVSTGSHHADALIPVAILAVLLAYGAWSQGSRPALVALGVLGLLTLVLALAADLPDAHATGLIAAGSGHYANASSTPQAGLYMETLGAAVLIVTAGLGLLLGGAPPGPRPSAGVRVQSARQAPDLPAN